MVSMTHWKIINDEDAKLYWDNWASQMPFCSPFQSYAKGQVLRQIGILPIFCVNIDPSGVVRAMALCSIKFKFSKVAIFVCAGGPMGDHLLWSGILDVLAKAANVRLAYLRVRNDNV